MTTSVWMVPAAFFGGATLAILFAWWFTLRLWNSNPMCRECGHPMAIIYSCANCSRDSVVVPLPPKHPCACGHAHAAGSDGEDCGCRACKCSAWVSP